MRSQPILEDLFQFDGIFAHAAPGAAQPAAASVVTLADIADMLAGAGARGADLQESAAHGMDGFAAAEGNAPTLQFFGPADDGLGSGYNGQADFDFTAFSGLTASAGPGEIFAAWLDGGDALSAGRAAAADAGAGAPGESAAGGPDIAPIFDAFDAKGGNGGGGGGGGGKPDKGGGGDANVLTNYYSGSADGDAGYDIWISFSGAGWTTELQSAFIHAADYFTTVITDDIGGGGFYRGNTIDDLYVTAELATIDGTGGILGQAGPSAIWTANDLTAAGGMQFDVADAADYLGRGLWDDIVTHELMHVLGFGSLWNYGSHALVDGGQYIGEQGLAAYREVMGDTSLTGIAVETDGGSGTAGAHWDEATFNNELMTGYINDDRNAATDTDNFLSKFSVMSLADLGYAVDYQDYPYDGQLLVG